MVATFLSRILDRTADAAFAANSEGFICVWNHSAEELFGYSASEALNMPCSELLSCHTSADTRICCERCGVISHCLAGRKVPNFDMKAKVSSGAWIWINVLILVFVDERTNHRLVAHLARDISRRKESENLSQQLIQLVNQIAKSPQREDLLVPIMPLTEQEQKILKDLSSGRSPVTVARDLDITAGTLRNHLHRVNKKLGTHNRLEAIMQAKRRGVI